MWLISGLFLVPGCGDPNPDEGDGGVRDSGPVVDGGAGVPCADDSTCDDGRFCNGAETCIAGFCAAGEEPDCDDGVACTRDVCSDMRSECRNIVPDADGDGVGDRACVDGAGMPLGLDCDDSDPLRFPGNEEVCDADDRDEDCDPTTFGRVDVDGDRYRSAACCNVDDTGARLCGDDCDDTRAQVSPASTEACDGFDNDCDGVVDEGVGGALFRDADRDGHGDPTMPMSGCAGLVGFSTLDDDCDDTSPARHPAQLEFCDSIDNDCDTRIDEMASPVPWYPDTDGDGFGNRSATPTMSCTPLAGHSLLGTDCDDDEASRNPAAAEMCNGRDDDCDGEANFSIGVNDTEDDDEDGLADIACGGPLGVDCDDSDPATGGGEIERCDGRDNDCDGNVDEGATSVVWYLDADGDTYGSLSSGAMVSCAPISGYVRRAGDCDDTNPMRSPDAMESCNATDDDCDGATDEGSAGDMCALANATAECRGGACAIAVCAANFADCNGIRDDGCERALGTVSDCSGCGQACSGPGASYTCTAGVCTIEVCALSRADCNAFAGDGCEVRTDVDDENCGSCGRVCSAPRARTRCEAAGCIIESCDAGFADCDGDFTNGCEQSILDVAHCGGCGRVCGGGAGAMVVCEPPGFCRVTGCMPGFEDCDGDALNGCESPTSTDPMNCGGCGTRCMGANTMAMRCDAGLCAVDSCLPGFLNCDGDPFNGCESRSDDPLTCGSCMNNCVPFPNAEPGCSGGACALGRCFGNSADCNGVPGDGCEANLDSDPMRCGSCMATPCSLPNSLPGCFGGVCGVAGCTGGFGDCNLLAGDGCERDLRFDAMNCGGCGIQCGPGGVCNEGACDRIEEVATGAQFTCARRQGGGVTCWGANAQGQLGDGTNIGRTSPQTAVAITSTATQVCAGDLHACAVLESGFIECWGSNGAGQLGRGTVGSFFSTPQRVMLPGGASPSAVACGSDHTCAITSMGVYCWGSNSTAQLGIDPMMFPGSFGTPQLARTGFARGVTAGLGFTCMHDDMEVISCWGVNGAAQLGSGSISAPDYLGVTPSVMPRSGSQQIMAGRSHACLLQTDGLTECWGENLRGQLGDGSTLGPAPPTLAGPISTAQLGGGRNHTCFLSRSGTIRCFGDDSFGQRGTGTVSPAPGTSPVSPLPPPSLYYQISRSASAEHTCAITGGGSVYCWGANGSGQVGSGMSGASSPAPTEVVGLISFMP